MSERRRTAAGAAWVPWADWAAWGLLAVALLEGVVTVVAAAGSSLSWSELADLFVVSNALIGLALAFAGWPIAYYRPANPIGWLLLVGGCCYASTATGLSLLAWLGEPTVGWRLVATVTNGGWAPALALFIPLTLVLFPDGRLLSRRWRWLVVGLVVNAVLWTATGVLDRKGGLSAEIGIPGYPHWTGFAAVDVFGAISSAGLLVSFVAALVAVVLRYRRGSDQVRGQVLWLLLALLVIVACFGLENLVSSESLVLGVLPLLLIPLAVAVAVLRHQLLDIRLVVSRSLLYLVLVGGVVAAYFGLIALLDRNASVLATLAIALAFNPVRVWLQGLIHRAFYGARRDPVRAMAEVGAQMGSGLTGVLAALCRVMRFPAATIVVEGKEISAYGDLPAARHAISLRPGPAPGPGVEPGSGSELGSASGAGVEPGSGSELGSASGAGVGPGPGSELGSQLGSGVEAGSGSGSERLGELVVGLRPGESRLNAADEQVLSLLAAPLAVAVQARGLADDLRESRERIISGREEERRRIRRDLHDGLGPVLTAVVLNADAARRLIEAEPERSAALLAELRDQAIGAVEEIRRLVYELRPPALDGLGLLGALREYAAMASRRGDGVALTVTVDAPATLAELPAAVEVAAYRIATEALTNVIRHSTATTAAVRLSVETDALRLGVLDNGMNTGPQWKAGVGLTSMNDRATELGGQCKIRYDQTGCRIDVVLPLEGARR